MIWTGKALLREVKSHYIVHMIPGPPSGSAEERTVAGMGQWIEMDRCEGDGISREAAWSLHDLALPPLLAAAACTVEGESHRTGLF